LGPSLTARTAPEVARSIEDNGAVGVTVHGRAADQHYGDPCHLHFIREVVQAVSIPVIANGDVRDAASAVRTLDATGAAGVMVARAALTRPWVFREIAAALNDEPVPPPPTAREQKALLLKNHAALVEREGDPRGTILMRKFACRYIAGAPGTHAFRDAITRAKDGVDFRGIVERLFPLDDASFSECAGSTGLEEAACG
jgi:tRNA-dihydrouridine synthase B